MLLDTWQGVNLGAFMIFSSGSDVMMCFVTVTSMIREIDKLDYLTEAVVAMESVVNHGSWHDDEGLLRGSRENAFEARGLHGRLDFVVLTECPGRRERRGRAMNVSWASQRGNASELCTLMKAIINP